MDVEAHLADPALKQAFVTPMFDVIAPKYDEFTRRFSFGMDVRWKRELIADAVEALPPAGTALDVACGTGDLAFALAARRPRARILGIDASQQMIAQAEKRGRAAEIYGMSPSFRVGDLTKLELPDASVDLVTGGYALRNVPDWHAGLRELARVLRPGGRLVTLDFYRPEQVVWRTLYLGYLRVAGDLVGLRWHGRAVIYGYIARSIRDFVSWRSYSAALTECGFRDVRVRTHLMGGVALHVATRA
jgi:demethylmenaquinone methyltransferase/2-methoxy-6-polyprenyl-1,4-benzoquinol methylase